VLGQLRKLSGNNDVQFIKLDLTSLQSIKEFTEDFLARYDRYRGTVPCRLLVQGVPLSHVLLIIISVMGNRSLSDFTLLSLQILANIYRLPVCR
jgi:hypothetical protein